MRLLAGVLGGLVLVSTAAGCVFDTTVNLSDGGPRPDGPVVDAPADTSADPPAVDGAPPGDDGPRRDRQPDGDGCVPRGCEPGVCGSFDDGCGGTLDCQCPAMQTCGAEEPNRCGCAAPLLACSEGCADPEAQATCGACDHHCGEAPCLGDGRCAPQVLVDGQATGGGIAVDAMHVYYTVQGAAAGMGSIRRVLLGGGTPETVASGLFRPSALRLRDGDVYFVDTGAGTVGVVRSGGMTAETLAMNEMPASSVAVDGTYVYWANSAGDRQVKRVRRDGTGEVERLSMPQSSPSAVAVTDSHVYWVDYSAGALRRSAFSPGSEETLSSGETRATDLRIVGNTVYFVIQGPIASPGNGAIRRWREGDATASTVVGNLSNVSVLEVSARQLFFNSIGVSATVHYVALAEDGTALAAPEAVASSQRNPGTFAIDQDTVYWVNAGVAGSDGQVVRLTRPIPPAP